MVYVFPGPLVVVPGRVARSLWHYANLEAFAARVRGQDPEIDAVLAAIRQAGNVWVRAATGTRPAQAAEPAREWFTTREAAEVLRITPRGVRKAIGEDRLQARASSNGWLIAAEDLAQFKARRAA